MVCEFCKALYAATVAILLLIVGLKLGYAEGARQMKECFSLGMHQTACIRSVEEGN